MEYIKGIYPEFEVSIGGQISVDIYPKGKNKSQVVEKIRELHGEDVEMIFVGDRNVPGGNDWPLCEEGRKGRPSGYRVARLQWNKIGGGVKKSAFFVPSFFDGLCSYAIKLFS